MSDIKDRLAASLKYDAINGDAQERAVVASQIKEAIAALAEKDAEIEQWKRIIVTHVDVIAEKEREVHDLKMEMNRMVRY